MERRDDRRGRVQRSRQTREGDRVIRLRELEAARDARGVAARGHRAVEVVHQREHRAPRGLVITERGSEKAGRVRARVLQRRVRPEEGVVRGPEIAGVTTADHLIHERDERIELRLHRVEAALEGRDVRHRGGGEACVVRSRGRVVRLHLRERRLRVRDIGVRGLARVVEAPCRVRIRLVLTLQVRLRAREAVLCVGERVLEIGRFDARQLLPGGDLLPDRHRDRRDATGAAEVEACLPGGVDREKRRHAGFAIQHAGLDPVMGDAQVVEQGDGIPRHLFDGMHGPWVRRPPTAARIEDDHAQRLGQLRHLVGQPDIAGEASRRNEHERLARPVRLVVQVDARG